MRAILWCTAAVLVASSASGEVPYNSDPDPNRPTLPVHPPALKPEDARPRAAAKSVINGITVVDVLFAAGFVFSGGDYGNEPAVTANPVNPDQIVLTSFSGSAWPSGNRSLFYSADRGNTWTYSLSIPPPPGTSGPGCPCDQTVDWDRDGRLYGTFLLFDSISAVYSAQTTTPTVASSWTYRVESGAAQKTNLPALAYPDQPWVWSGPLVGDPTKTGTEKAFNASFASMWGNVSLLMNTIGMAVVFAILLVTANAMMMSARERTREVAVLKTIGFSDGRLFALVLSEEGASALTGEAAAVQFVMDAFGHLKAIGHTAGAKALLDKAGVAPDAGVVGLDGEGFVKAAAKRFFDREPLVRPAP